MLYHEPTVITKEFKLGSYGLIQFGHAKHYGQVAGMPQTLMVRITGIPDSYGGANYPQDEWFFLDKRKSERTVFPLFSEDNPNHNFLPQEIMYDIYHGAWEKLKYEKDHLSDSPTQKLFGRRTP